MTLTSYGEQENRRSFGKYHRPRTGEDMKEAAPGPHFVSCCSPVLGASRHPSTPRLFAAAVSLLFTRGSAPAPHAARLRLFNNAPQIIRPAHCAHCNPNKAKKRTIRFRKILQFERMHQQLKMIRHGFWCGRIGTGVRVLPAKIFSKSENFADKCTEE